MIRNWPSLSRIAASDEAAVILYLSSIVSLTRIIGRATDYIMGDHQARILEITDHVEPLVWGATCLLAAVLVVAGILTSRLHISALGALIAAVTYGTFAVIRLGDTVMATPADDWRFPVDHACTAAAWSIAAILFGLRAPVLQARREEEMGGADAGDPQ